jgi:hypothetical protein
MERRYPSPPRTYPGEQLPEMTMLPVAAAMATVIIEPENLLRMMISLGLQCVTSGVLTHLRFIPMTNTTLQAAAASWWRLATESLYHFLVLMRIDRGAPPLAPA